jgi:uncharacterized delta-60 repeat protein
MGNIAKSTAGSTVPVLKSASTLQSACLSASICRRLLKWRAVAVLSLGVSMLAACGGGGGGGGSSGGAGGGGSVGAIAGVATGTGNGVALNANGQLHVAGFAPNTSGVLEMRLWRYSANGNLDTSFNAKGYVSHPGNAGTAGATVGLGVATDANGKVVVCGYSFGQDSLWGATVWRYLPDGTLDTSFNGSGYQRITTRQGGGVSCALDGSGRIVVAGFAWNGSNWDAAVWRLLSSGALDTTFNGTGVVLHDSAAGGSGEDIAIGITLDGAGRIVVTGYSTNSAGNQDAAVWRFNTNGTLDTSFNGTGFVTADNTAGGGGNDVGRSVAVDATGKIVVTGWSRSASAADDMVVWRFTSAGAPDTTFAGTGFVRNNGAAGAPGTDEGRDVVIDGSGNITVAGTSTDGAGRARATLWRYLANGTLDTTFNGSGYVVFPAGQNGGGDSGRGLVLDALGRLWEVGLQGGGGSTPQVGIWNVTS